MCPAFGAAGRAPRWCPTAEQVLLLGELYRGGLTNPSASQIHQIVSHLSQFGKIQGKNVFYWFQNHKARDKQKIRKKPARQQLKLALLRMSATGMQDGGWVSSLARPLPKPSARYISRWTPLVTLDLFPVTPGSNDECSNKLSGNYIHSRARNSPQLLPNLNLTLGAPEVSNH